MTNQPQFLRLRTTKATAILLNVPSLLGLLLVVTSVGAWSQTTYSPVVGFVKVTVNGTSSGSGDNFVGPALLEGEAYRGDIVAGTPAAFTLQAADAAWTANQFATIANSHFVEIVASTNPNAVGLYSDIASNTANTLTTTLDLSGQLAGGETIAIRPHKTIAKVFGATNDYALGQGAAATSDTISVLTPGTSPSFASYYYRANQSLGGTGWRSTANPVTDQANRPLRIGEGLLIKRKQTASTEIILHGYVHEGSLRIPLKKGFNLVDPVAPVTDQSAATPTPGPVFSLGGLASSTRIPSMLDALLLRGGSSTADILSIRSGTSFISYYYRSGQSLGGTGWRTTTNPATNVETTVLPATAAYYFQIRGNGGNWVRPQTFSLP